MEQNKIKNFIALIVLVATIFGLMAGMVGGIISKVYEIDKAANIPLLGDVNLSDANRSNLVIRDAKKVVVEQNDKVIETANSVGNTLVGIFAKKSASENHYYADDAIAQGLIVTSDGWVVTNVPVFGSENVNLSDFVIITKDKNIYQIDKLAVDKLTKFYFLHINAFDLPAASFADNDSVKNGQLVLATNWDGSSLLTSILNDKKDSNRVKFSDAFSDKILIANNLDKNYHGLALFNLAGETVALVNDDGKIESISHLYSAITSLLKDKSIKRASLGVYYSNYGELISINPKKDSLGQDKGAVITPGPSGLVAVKGSAAEAAGLKEGDIIISVNNIDIDRKDTLSDVVERFLPGEKLSISFLRDGQRKHVDAKLAEVK